MLEINERTESTENITGQWIWQENQVKTEKRKQVTCMVESPRQLLYIKYIDIFQKYINVYCCWSHTQIYEVKILKQKMIRNEKKDENEAIE